jgi:hypothetical protein
MNKRFPMSRLRFPRFAIALLISCDQAPRTGYDVNESTIPRESATAKFDTLAGLRLGMMLPEVRETWHRQGRQLRCDSVIGGLHCTNELTRAIAEGAIGIEIRQGLVVMLMHSLVGRDWGQIPIETYLNAQEAFGTPTEQSSADGYVIVWASDSTYRKLICSDGGSTASSCIVFVGRGAPVSQPRGRG